MVRRSAAVLVILSLLLVVGAVSAQPERALGVSVFSDGFESGNLSAWKSIVHSPANRKDDKVKCGALGYNGSDCAMSFRGGANEGSSLKVVTPGSSLSHVPAGSLTEVQFMTHVKRSNAKQKMVVVVRMIFTNDTIDKLELFKFVKTGAAADGYELFSDGVTVDLPEGFVFHNITWIFRNKSPNGKTFLDDVDLLVTPTT